MKIVVVGAGHAGVEAAKAAHDAGADSVVLLSAESVLPYFRPRLVAVAFGQQELAAALMHDADWYTANGIDLRLDAAVCAIDVARKNVRTAGGEFAYDALVLANGAGPIVPPVKGDAGAVLPLWNQLHAAAIRRHVNPGRRAVVIGGGILGIEAALRAREAGMDVLMVEKMRSLMPAQFGQRASSVLLHRLQANGITVSLGRTLIEVRQPTGQKDATAVLDDGTRTDCAFVLMSIGARPAAALAQQAGLATDRGVLVDANLRAASANVFVAGDIVQFAGITRCSVREAVNQGRIAGANAVAALQGGALQEYRAQSAPLTFKSGTFELYALGQPSGEGTEEVCLEGSSEHILRSLVVKDGVTLGVQMIGTREGFDTYAKQVQGVR